MFNNDDSYENIYSSDQFMESTKNILYFNDKNFYSRSEDSEENYNTFTGKKRKLSSISNSQEEAPNLSSPYFLKSTKEKSTNIIKNIESKNENKNITIKKIPKFKVNYDLTIEEILKIFKDKNLNNHIIDYYFQYFKREFANYYTNLLNDSIKKCEFIKNIKIFSVPNNKFFQSKSTYSINKEYLNYTMEEIYIKFKYIENKNEGRNQIKNIKITSDIKIVEYKNQNEYYNLINLLNNILEIAYRLFYDDKIAFFIFTRKKLTRYYDYFFKKMYGYSLLENYGIIKFIKNKK